MSPPTASSPARLRILRPAQLPSSCAGWQHRGHTHPTVSMFRHWCDNRPPLVPCSDTGVTITLISLSVHWCSQHPGTATATCTDPFFLLSFFLLPSFLPSFLAWRATCYAGGSRVHQQQRTLIRPRAGATVAAAVHSQARNKCSFPTSTFSLLEVYTLNQITAA